MAEATTIFGVEQSKIIILIIIIITDIKSKYVCARVFWFFLAILEVVALRTSHGSFLWYALSLSNCVQRQFCLRPMAVHPGMKRVCKGARLIISFELWMNQAVSGWNKFRACLLHGHHVNAKVRQVLWQLGVQYHVILIIGIHIWRYKERKE